jgi:hypothetical protein
MILQLLFKVEFLQQTAANFLSFPFFQNSAIDFQIEDELGSIEMETINLKIEIALSLWLPTHMQILAQVL